MYLFRGGRDFDLIFWGIRILKGRKKKKKRDAVLVLLGREGEREGGKGFCYTE